MLQHSRAMYGISYISWLQLAAEYGGCSQLILTDSNFDRFQYTNQMPIDFTVWFLLRVVGYIKGTQHAA